MTPLPLWSVQRTATGPSRQVSLSGELDLAAAEDLRRMLIAELDTPGATGLVADLTAVTFLDSAALGALVGVYQHADDNGLSFRVTNPARAARHVLEVSGVYDILVVPA